MSGKKINDLQKYFVTIFTSMNDHGRFLEAHRSDRQRQNAMTLVGWRILRFTAGEARDPHGSCLAVIEEALSETPNLEAIGRLFRPMPAHAQKTKRSR